jgi:hypothetical protein
MLNVILGRGGRLELYYTGAKHNSLNLWFRTAGAPPQEQFDLNRVYQV